MIELNEGAWPYVYSQVVVHVKLSAGHHENSPSDAAALITDRLLGEGEVVER